MKEKLSNGKMNLIFVFPFLLILVGCSTLPQMYQAVEDIADDEAIQVQVSKEAIQKQTDISIQLDIKNNPLVK